MINILLQNVQFSHSLPDIITRPDRNAINQHCRKKRYIFRILSFPRSILYTFLPAPKFEIRSSPLSLSRPPSSAQHKTSALPDKSAATCRRNPLAVTLTLLAPPKNLKIPAVDPLYINCITHARERERKQSQVAEAPDNQ